MTKLGTLDTIIDDILLELRNSNISESEQINRLQIEQWVIQYRAMLIKQDIDRGRDVNPSYVQEIDNINLNIVDYASGELGEASDKILVTEIEIPKTIDFHFKSGITSIMDQFGNEVQLMSEKRSNMQKYRKYTFYAYSAFIKKNRIYINGPGDIRSINIRGIFEDPSTVPGFDRDNDVFPIPFNMMPAIKSLIFEREIKIQLPTDTTNNSSDDTQNIAIKNR